MAFNMNRPIIKGTSLHKASIAKAKSESIVTQTRTQADASLVSAGDTLGKSYIPAAIDFSIDQKAIKIPESEGKGKGKKKSKTDGIDPTNKTGMVDVMINGVKTSVAAKDRFKYESVGRGEKKKEVKKKVKKEKVDKEGTVASRLFGRAKQAAEARKKQKEKDHQTAQAEKQRIQAEKASKTAKQRLGKAEEDGGFDTENDYSFIEGEPSARQIKSKKYQSPDATGEGDAMLERAVKDRETKLNKAAKKHNVKPEDLEAKEINGEKEFFPKQGSVGGEDETRWDDKLGRFKKAEVTAGTAEELRKAVAEMKPKYPEGMDPNLEAKGEIALNYSTNTYEYTAAYSSRIAREKIAAIEAERANQNAVTSEPVVEEKDQNTVTTRTREQKEDDKIYNDFRTSKYKKKKMIEGGYSPIESKSPMEMRDDRIYRNARVDGPVRKNMIKGGYKPQ